MTSSIPTTVLDLPQIYTQPSAAQLLTTLELLAIKPTAWDPVGNTYPRAGKTEPAIDEEGIPKYLTGIVSCPLSWIDEERKEQIWEMASRRLSERAGRTALPSISRTFPIPNPLTQQSIAVTLHEPSLTSDNLGHKTWAASHLLAQRLPWLLPHLPCLRPPPPLLAVGKNGGSPAHHQDRGSSPVRRARVLELGAGTGLVGIAAAALFPAVNVHLTDLPAIVPNLQANLARNGHILAHAADGGGTVSAGVLDWSHLPADDDQVSLRKSDIILAADPLYSPLHPLWLTDAMGVFLKRDITARIVVELPLRDAYLPEVEEFRRRMEVKGFALLACGEEVGYDDWKSGAGHGGGKVEVICWWGVWGWGD